jgi:hypothetical protein
VQITVSDKPRKYNGFEQLRDGGRPGTTTAGACLGKVGDGCLGFDAVLRGRINVCDLARVF